MFITIDGTEIMGVHLDEVDGAIPITKDEFVAITKHGVGQAAFTYVGGVLSEIPGKATEILNDMEARKIQRLLIEKEKEKYLNNAVAAKINQFRGMTVAQLRMEMNNETNL